MPKLPAATTVGYDANTVEGPVRDLQRVVEELQDDSPQSLAARVRQKVWWAFTVDTWERSSTRAEGLSRVLHELLSIDISLDEARNSWELRVWSDVLSDRQEQRQAKGTLKWWTAVSKEVIDFLDSPAYQAPALPDLRAELRDDIDAALDDPNSLTNQFRAEIAD